LAQGHDVHLISFVRADEKVDLEPMTRICSSVKTIVWQEFYPQSIKALLGFFSSKPRSVMDTYSQEIQGIVDSTLDSIKPNIAIASESATAPYLINHQLIPKIFEDVEIGVIHDARKQASNPASYLRRELTWQKTRRYNAKLMAGFNACTVVSEPERAILRTVAPKYNSVHVIPNGVDIESMLPGGNVPQPNLLIYNGALTYTANLDAMKYFLEDIFPAVLGEIPDAYLRITGSTKNVNLDSLNLNKNVELTGFLSDVRPTVAAAWACVVPLRVGGGTRLKILEAMALGTPVISTSKGAEGLDVTHEENILIADTPKSFAVQTVRLLGNPELRDRLAQNGRNLVETKYGWQSIGDKFVQLVEFVAIEHVRSTYN